MKIENNENWGNYWIKLNNGYDLNSPKSNNSKLNSIFNNLNSENNLENFQDEEDTLPENSNNELFEQNENDEFIYDDINENDSYSLAMHSSRRNINRKRSGTKNTRKSYNTRRTYQSRRTYRNSNTYRTRKTNNSNSTRKTYSSSKSRTESMGFNGRIDRNFSQGTNMGDCWLLAGIKALSMSPNGSKYLKDIVTILPNGNIQVKLRGVNKTYVYKPEQIKRRTDLSSGDLDVRAIEMAIDDYLRSNPLKGSKGRSYSSIRVGDPKNLFKILIPGKSPYSGRINGKWDDKLIKNFNDKNKITCVGSKKGTHTIKTSKGTIKIYGDHEYAVKGSDKNYVYLVDPHNTSKTIALPIHDFKRLFDSISYVKL